MEKAAHYESEESRFESWQGRNILSHTKIDFIHNIYCHYYLPQIRGLVAQWIKASDYESGDSRLESWQGRNILSDNKIDVIPNIYCHYYIRGLVAHMDKASDLRIRGFQV